MTYQDKEMYRKSLKLGNTVTIHRDDFQEFLDYYMGTKHEFCLKIKRGATWVYLKDEDEIQTS